MEETTRYRDELSSDVKTYVEWLSFANDQSASISHLGKDNNDRLMIRRDSNKELLADLIRIEHN